MTTGPLIILGAGVSLDFGASSTAALTRKLEGRILEDAWMVRCGGDRAWTEIRRILGDYLEGGCEAVNFEHHRRARTEELCQDPLSGGKAMSVHGALQ